MSKNSYDYVCHCSCHKNRLKGKTHDRKDCCAGKCPHCDSYIKHGYMDDHINEFHPNIEKFEGYLEIPQFLRKSSD